MAKFDKIKEAVKSAIKQNGNQEITGNLLQSTLLSIIDTIGVDKAFMGIATPTTNPGTPEGEVYYFASKEGAYPNFPASINTETHLANSGLWVIKNDTTTGYWSATRLIEITQELGNSTDKVVSQNVISSLSQINIENGYSGIYNNISIDRNTLTIKATGFSIICVGKRIVFTGSEDKVYQGTGVRTSLYINPKYLVGTSAVDFTTNSDVFVLKQDSVYNGILFAQWYQSKLMSTGLIATIKVLSDTTKQLSDTTKQLSDTTKQLSDTTKQLSDTNNIQIYCLNNTFPYIEETNTDKVYVNVKQIGIRSSDNKKNVTYEQKQLLTAIGVEGVTSPKGVKNCLEISPLENFVYDLSDYKFKLINRLQVASTHIVLLANVGGKIALTKNSSIYNQWVDSRINDTTKQLSDTTKQLSDVSQNVDTNKEGNIINNIAKNSDFKFMFYSDVHGSANNVQRILDKSKALGTSYVDCILNGGDTVQNFNSEGLAWYNELYEKTSVPMLTAVGNHDAWSSNYWVWDSAENIYNLVTKKIKESVPSIVQPSDVDTSFANYYYYDTDKVRIIVLLSLKFTGDDAFYDDTQNEWLKAVLADAKTNNKAVIIMNHGPIDPKDSEELESNWSSKLTWTKDLKDTQHLDDRILACVDDFINDGGTFICYLAGHSHVDYLLHSKSHPKQMCLVIASARYNYTGDCYKSGNKSNKDYDLYNYIGVDLTHSIIKVMRIGCNNNAWMQEHNTLCVDFKNCKVLADH